MQYIKKPLTLFLYRMIFSVFGPALLSGLLINFEYLFSAILLALNLPVFYSTAAGIAKEDKKSYRHTTPYGAKGLVMGLLYLVPCAILSCLIGARSVGFTPGLNFGFLLITTPYLAIIGNVPNITYFLPVIVDLTVITLGYIAGMNNISLVRLFREHILYEKKEKNDEKKS